MSNDETYYPLIINSSGLVPNANNNTYRYTFPVGSVKFEGSKVAISNISLFYSWFNISAAYNNNTFQIIWPIGGSTTTYTLTLPDGYYDVAGLNSYIQQFCITNGLYLINTSSEYVYYIELQENANYYAIQLNTFPIPTSLPSGWTAPGTWVGYPTTGYTPQLVVPANNFRNTIGFAAGTFPPVQQTSTYSKLSTTVPQVTVVQSIVVACSLLNNRYSNPGTIIYSFSPAGVAFGGLIESKPTQYSFIDIQNGNYPYFDVSFYDQNFNPLKLNDTNLIIQLLIKSGRKNSSVSY